MMELYLYAKTKQFYIKIEEKVFCSSCNKEIYGLAILYNLYGKKGSYATLCHPNCKLNPEIGPVVKEAKPVILNDTMPEESYPIIHLPPLLVPGRVSTVFEAAELKSDITEDRTVYAGKESLEGAEIGTKIFLDEKEEYLTSEKQLDDRLRDIKESTPLLTKKEKKRLKHDTIPRNTKT